MASSGSRPPSPAANDPGDGPARDGPAPDGPAPDGPAAPLPRPLLVYDGDCGFCRRSVARWRGITRGRVDDAPSQAVADRFPQVPRGDFQRAVVLIEPGGRVRRGAAAVFATLAVAPRWKPAWWAYRWLPGARPLSEAAYRFVADHRPAFTRLDRALVGPHEGPSTWRTTRRLVCAGVALVALLACLSLWVQIDGLAGSRGIAPAAALLDAAEARFGGPVPAIVPTLLWFDRSDVALHGLCATGVVLSLALLADVLPGLAALLLWAVYLSLIHACGPFLHFQWDSLLVETLPLVALWAPWRPAGARGDDREPSRWGRLLLWWLLLRFMLESGVVKLTSGDPSWWPQLTALGFHHWTQPLPHLGGWWLAHLPAWAHAASTAAALVLELFVPLAIFGPRRFRLAAAALMIALQVAIAASGNYGFFNLLTIVLCLSLLDDQAWSGWRARRARREAARAAGAPARGEGTPAGEATGGPAAAARIAADRAAPPPGTCGLAGGGALPPWTPPRRAPAPQRAALAVAAVAALLLGGLQLRDVLGDLATTFGFDDPFGTPARFTAADVRSGALDTLRRVGPAAALRVADVELQPFLLVNSYGLFRVMTKTRPEILIEGSADGETWRPYAFRWKPSRLDRPPTWAGPHMPRLDWLLWFEALRWESFVSPLRAYQASWWFDSLLQRLLEGEPAVLDLFAADPFPDGPPIQVRARLQQWRFTTLEEHAATGDWWVAHRGYPAPYDMRRRDG